MTQLPVALLEGYRSFIDGRYASDRERYSELAIDGQRPQTLVIACCDSRVAPETIFNCGPGELFVVRNVANLVPVFAPDSNLHGTSAALEFAVQGLRVKHIVVMGHGRCGGIQAALKKDAEPLSSGDFIGNWMGQVAPLAEQIQNSEVPTNGDPQTSLERASVRNSINNLLTFPFISDPFERGELHLHGTWFDIATGELWVMDSKSGEFHKPSKV